MRDGLAVGVGGRGVGGDRTARGTGAERERHAELRHGASGGVGHPHDERIGKAGTDRGGLVVAVDEREGAGLAVAGQHQIAATAGRGDSEKGATYDDHPTTAWSRHRGANPAVRYGANLPADWAGGRGYSGGAAVTVIVTVAVAVPPFPSLAW